MGAHAGAIFLIAALPLSLFGGSLALLSLFLACATVAAACVCACLLPLRPLSDQNRNRNPIRLPLKVPFSSCGLRIL